MASYLILTPPGAGAADAVRTRFVRDGFSFVAFVFPVLWLFFHRLWFFAVIALLLEGIGGELMSRDGFLPAGLAILLGVSLLAALEGRNAYVRSLATRGWKETDLVSAGRLEEAEHAYFADIPEAGSEPVAGLGTNIAEPSGSAARRRGSGFGLIGYDGGR